MLVPLRRGELDEFSARILPLDTNPELDGMYRMWNTSRGKFNNDLKVPNSAAAQERWQKDYFHGQLPNGAVASEHRTRMHLKPFKRERRTPGC